VVRGIIGVAHHFGLQTIVEGIEGEPTLELVRELGADFGQGNYLGQPAPVSALLG
jgi:EAL domain-containing protein (putative c-di-GMP-specific phosphodiesterase class I)